MNIPISPIRNTIMQTSLLVVPQAFIECEVRVYDKRKLKDRIQDDQDVHQDLRYSIIQTSHV